MSAGHRQFHRLVGARHRHWTWPSRHAHASQRRGRFVVEGKFEGDGAGVGRPGFASEIDADGKALQQIRPKLIPVLEGKGPMVLSVGSTSRELPVAGLAKPLSGFK